MVALTTAITIGTAVLGAGLSFKAQSDQARAQKKLGRAQDAANEKLVANSKKQNALRLTNLRRENDRKRRQSIREFLQARGRAIGGAANRGSLGSSGLAGSLAGLSAQQGSNLGSITRGEVLAGELSDTQNEAADIKGVANLAQTAFNTASAQNSALNSFGDTLFANAGKIGNLGGSLFGSSTNSLTGSRLAASTRIT